MIRGLLTVLLITVVKMLAAQGNLVPNSGFEDHISCPPVMNQWNLCVNWTNPAPTSPDYYHMCAPSSSSADVPNNWPGSQPAHADSAYAGIISFAWGAREYIQTALADSLIAGQIYCVEYFVSLAGRSRYATIPPQLYFSDTTLTTTQWSGIVLTPSIMETSICSDTTNWVLVQGNYTAHGGESYLTIGHFFADSSTSYDSVSISSWPVAYFYIDDVSVIKKLNANAGISSAVCINDSIQLGITLDPGVVYSWSPGVDLSDSLSPNPWAKPLVTTTYYLTISDTGNLYCTGNLVDSVTITVNDCTPPPALSVPTMLSGGEVFYITSLPANSNLKIFDTRGRLVLYEENYQNDFTVTNLDAAIYLYELTLPDLTVQKGKFCVVR